MPVRRAVDADLAEPRPLVAEFRAVDLRPALSAPACGRSGREGRPGRPVL